ncbi:HAMP domain-containing histidine kinase [Bradyrhizobium embrapense]|uniref:HAMP domain-containing histidine kinase n=1 Tax=Bradyrhizobium embrapense TaxID=630921 RepID=UPI000A6B84D3|nr:HAMP domain-containing histidine kinase [Bradyrhizobium embrapense]
MTPEQFTALIASKRSADRRLAGREIALNPTLVERAVIEAAYYSETVPQIRQQFGSALETLNASMPMAAEPAAEQAREIYDEAFLKAMRTVTERVLHQLNPLIGDIEHAAAQEVPDFLNSRTKTAIGQIQLQATAITKLYNASKPAVIEEFDLATVVRNCLPHDLEHQRCFVSFAGPQPALVQGDPSLVTIAVTNGIRNAIEACLPIAGEDHKPAIVVNWGRTDRDNWVSIIDEGMGFSGSISGAFEIGTSSKGHSGHGLPAAKAAMLSLSGTIELVPQKDRGCTLNLNWPIISVQS